MPLSVTEIEGIAIVEGDPKSRIIERSQDIARVLEVCLSNRSRDVVLYPANLPDTFFDLSSGAAGELLQKAQSFGLRIAIVTDPARFSTHFEKVLNRTMAVFPSRDEAVNWLTHDERRA